MQNLWKLWKVQKLLLFVQAMTVKISHILNELGEWFWGIKIDKVSIS